MNDAKVAVTFSGKYGDILWSLPTAREIARQYGPVDFYVMPAFESICPLLAAQPYVNEAVGLSGWDFQNDGCGAQPITHPPIVGYDHVFDLTYPTWPDQPLIDFTARTAVAVAGPISGLPHLTPPVLPFLEPATLYTSPVIDIAVAFKFPQKMDIFFKPFLNRLEERLGRRVSYAQPDQLPWATASHLISIARIYVGDKSANHVIAHGLNKPVLTYETDYGRHNHIFSCPYGREIMPVPLGSHMEAPPNLNEFVEAAATLLANA